MISYKNITEETSLQEQANIRQHYSGGKGAVLFSTCKVYMYVFFLATFIYFIYIGCSTYMPTELSIHLKTDKIVQTVDEKFLSIALDTAFLKYRWRHFNISSEKLLQVTRHLSPGYLRVGGTLADKLIFQDDSESNQNVLEDKVIKTLGAEYSERLENSEPFIMTGEDWKKLNNFSKNAGLKLLFDLNVLLRQGDDWNSSNAVQLIKYSDANGFDVDWQLGNEPNSFHHVFNVSISGSQLAKDFIALKHILNSYPRYAKSLLVGPDVTRPKITDSVADSSIHYLNDFLNHINGSIDVVTWHQYYLDGHKAKLDDFLDPAELNMLFEQINAIKLEVQFAHNISRNTPIWLSETGSAYGGGAKSLSDRFVASFLWLDKLGIAARMGVQVVVRQALYHGNYEMLDETSLSPLPDWWLSVIYKKFVSSRVIDSTIFLGPVRVYCHCTPKGSSMAPGTVTIFGLNMGYAEAMITPSVGLKRGSTFSYILTGEFGATSKVVLLNNQLLNLNEDGSLPHFYPTSVATPYLLLPPQSIGFFILHGIVVDACID